MAVVAAIVIALVEWARVIHAPGGDFSNHWVFGMRFVNGDFLYANGLDVPYPPLWAMAHAPLAMVTPRIAALAVYPLGVLSLVCLVSILNRLTSADLPVDSRAVFWIGAAAIGLTLHFVLRDLDEGGPNIALVASTWAAVYCWRHDRAWIGGALLGCAIALKVTAILFVPYLLARRQWRFGFATCACAVAFTLMPLVWMAPSSYAAHVTAWSSIVWRGANEPDPRYGVLGLEKSANISLRPALARYLMHVPESGDDRGRYSHPLNVDLLNLSPATASWLVRLAVVALVAFTTLMLKDGRPDREDPRIVWDCATVGTLALLLSPITWKQHLVAIVPACYLLVRHRVARGQLPGVAWGALALVVISSLVASRDLTGVQVASLAHAYYLFTLSLLILLIAVVRCRGLVTATAETAAAGTAACSIGVAR